MCVCVCVRVCVCVCVCVLDSQASCACAFAVSSAITAHQDSAALQQCSLQLFEANCGLPEIPGVVVATREYRSVVYMYTALQVRRLSLL